MWDWNQRDIAIFGLCSIILAAVLGSIAGLLL